MGKINLKELQEKNFPCATVDDLPFDLTTKKDAEKSKRAKEQKKYFIKTINEYLKDFIPNDNCINCEKALGGIFGTFDWGLAHGEGFCSNCGYPARGKHYIKLKKLVVDGKEENRLTLPFILQYHPNTLKQRGKQ